MLRVHFTASDLLQVRFAPTPAPLMQLALALATLQRGDVLFERWRRELATAYPVAARPLFELVPGSGTGPMFLDPISDGLEDGLEQVLGASRAFVTAEVQRKYPAPRSVTTWVRGLEERDAHAWHILDVAMRAAHQSLIAPVWTRIQASYRAELALRTRQIAAAGLGEALRSLHSGSFWSGTTLHIPTAASLDEYPAGHGVTLLPSPMWTGRPLIGDHPDGSLLIVYRAAVPLPLVTVQQGKESLAHLIGHTRAGALQSLAIPHSTTELAHALGVSIATASEHAKVLRNAGLVTTTHDGKAVLHELTPLGHALLTG